MAKITEAVKTDYFVDFRKIIDQDKGDETPVTEEKQVAWMAKTPGWKLVKEYIEDLITALDIPARSSMEGGCSYEEIGRKTIVAQLTKEYLGKVLEKVSDAKESQETKD